MTTPNEDNGFISISRKELYDTLRRVEDKVTRLSLKVDDLTAQEKLRDHESRIRILESRFVGVTVAAVTVTLGGAAALAFRVF